MKITLDIDQQALAGEMQEFIKTLSVEDKTNMIKDIVATYYSDYRKFEDGEKQCYEEQLVQRIKANMDSYDKNRYTTDESIKTWYKFSDEMKKFKSYANITREEISSAIRIQLSTQIADFIKNDAGYQELLKESMITVKELFPQMVQQAMIRHMSDQLPKLTNDISQALGHFNDRIINIEQKLLR